MKTLKNTFQLKLGKEYYNKGIIQIPIKFKDIIPQEKGIKVKLIIQNDEYIIYPTFTLSGGNRKINGKNELKEWFNNKFKLNDLVNVEIISQIEFMIYK